MDPDLNYLESNLTHKKNERPFIQEVDFMCLYVSRMVYGIQRPADISEVLNRVIQVFSLTRLKKLFKIFVYKFQ